MWQYAIGDGTQGNIDSLALMLTEVKKDLLPGVGLTAAEKLKVVELCITLEKQIKDARFKEMVLNGEA